MGMDEDEESTIPKRNCPKTKDNKKENNKNKEKMKKESNKNRKRDEKSKKDIKESNNNRKQDEKSKKDIKESNEKRKQDETNAKEDEEPKQTRNERNHGTREEQESLDNWKLAHFQQKWWWDCGFACVMMVLPKQEKDKILKEDYSLQEVLKRLDKEKEKIDDDFDFKYKKRFYNFAKNYHYGDHYDEGKIQQELDSMNEKDPRTCHEI